MGTRTFRAPACFYADGGAGILVMENLVHRGVALYDRKKGMLCLIFLRLISLVVP